MTSNNPLQTTIIRGPRQSLRGTLRVPGDKSISHRALLLGGIASGETRVQGLLEGEDCLATLAAMRRLGVNVEKHESGEYRIEGAGENGLQEPEEILDLGNSGTATRLMIGLLAGYPIAATLTGDASVRRRPMLRVVEPIRRMGALVLGRKDGDRAPLTIQGGNLRGITYSSPLASAQVKSAILLAGLGAKGETRLKEPSLTRDHSERMLRAFGARIARDGETISIQGGKVLQGQPVQVPGDISSAAFFLVAGLLLPGSDITLRNVGLNPTRTGLIDVLQGMGGKIDLLEQREVAGERIGNIHVVTSALKGVEVGGSLVPRMIDEFPILTLAAICAEGRTVIRDAHELRFKESDRIAAIVRQFANLGIVMEEEEEGYSIEGPQKILAGQTESLGDHRIAMTLIVAGLLAKGESTVADTGCIATSFPDFFPLLAQLCGEEAVHHG